MGCPIRTSADQRLLASPRGFSQRATSFIASWRQGIHQMPLLRLRSGRHAQDEARPELTAGTSGTVTTEGDGTRSASHACPLHPPGSLRTMRRRHATEPSPPCQRTGPRRERGIARGLPPDARTIPNQRRHHPQGGGGERDRTDDLLLAKQALSQLSYAPKPKARPRPRLPTRQWWAGQDLNLRPHAYQACALTS